MSPALATRLIEPDYWTCPHGHRQRPDKMLTYGPEVADLCATANFAPDPQQELGLDLIFAVRGDGSPASFEFCVICARQNLKTGLFKQAALGWLFVTDQRLIVWSAHELDTASESQSELAALITECPSLSAQLPSGGNRGIYDANGDERIELADGRRIKFKARTGTGGRGLAAPKLILDEAFALKATMLGALLPLMTAQGAEGQVLYGSSAGKADSDALIDIRDRGRAGASPRLSYVEWCAQREPCADPACDHPKDAEKRGLDCALDRESIVLAANPTISTGRILLQTIRNLRQALPPDEFMRECLGWWDDPALQVVDIFGPGRWVKCASEILPASVEPLALGLAVAIDRETVSLVAGGLVEDGVDTEGDPVEVPYVSPVARFESFDEAVAEVKRMQDEHDIEVVIDRKGPTATLIDRLIDADVAVTELTLDQFADACAAMFDDVRARALRYPSGATELTESVRGAAWRQVGDRQVWGRRKSVAVEMLEAATLAKYGAENASAFTIG